MKWLDSQGLCILQGWARLTTHWCWILGTFIFLFLVHISFKNFTYDGTCCMASRRGTFIWTWLNIFLIFSIWALVLLVASLLGNGTIGLWVCSSVFFFWLDLTVDGCELEDEDGSFGTCSVVTGGFDTGLLELDDKKPCYQLIFWISGYEQCCIISELCPQLH